MCGIAGGCWKLRTDEPTRLTAALSAMHRRGPDDWGMEVFDSGSTSVGLGQTRLSIIDPSVAGHQPMHSSDGRWVIVFNGEIYNYLELKKELEAEGYRFVSKTDTEVLLTAWIQWRENCLPRLVGMFAFSILDRLRNQLICARDAFGIKPFFYTHQGSGFFFASEIPALLKLSTDAPVLNWQRAYDYLVHGDYDSGPDSFFTGIKHLSPGHWYTVDLAEAKEAGIPQRWWTPQTQETAGWNFKRATEQIRELFLDNVRMHLRSDVPLGAALSGGIDSSSIVCAIRHVARDLPINTFSYIVPGSDIDEDRWIDTINNHVGAIPHKVSANAYDLQRDLDEMIRAQGEPFGSTSIYAQYRVYKLARESGITVTLDGQGADELLAGYIGYPGQRLHSLLEERNFLAAIRFINNWSRPPGRSRSLAAKYLVSELTDGHLHGFLRRLNGMHSAPSWINEGVLHDANIEVRKPRIRLTSKMKGRRVMDELSLSLTCRGLPSLLRHGDRNSMHFSVESRVPFLTVEMANLLLSMPEDFLISRNGETKHVFRAAMRGIVPDTVLDRKDKIGFTTPEAKWLLSIRNDSLRSLIMDINTPFINQEAVWQEVKMIKAGEKPYTHQIWRWINFSRWKRMFL